jgi:tRNA G37 N-methylase TrmD
LPIYIAKKGKRSSPFFGVKTRKSHRQTGSALVLHGLKRRLCLVSNPRQTGKKQRLFFDDSQIGFGGGFVMKLTVMAVAATRADERRAVREPLARRRAGGPRTIVLSR